MAARCSRGSPYSTRLVAIRRKYRWMSCSQVTPMPPCICTQSWTISGAAFNNTAGGPGTYQVGIGTACTEGCGLPFAPNYVDPDSVDVVNNDLCDFTNYVMGCTYPDASNYDETATNDDGSCEFEIANPCPTDLNGDGQTTTSDLLIFLGAFGTDCE